MNKGGFSVSRFIGITRVKQNVARKTGVPFTKTGRERKIGAAASGNGSILNALFLMLINSIFSSGKRK